LSREKSILGPAPPVLPPMPRRSLLPPAPAGPSSLPPPPVPPPSLPYVTKVLFLSAEWFNNNILLLEYITNMHCQCGRKSTA